MAIINKKDIFDDSAKVFQNLLLDLERATELSTKLTESGKKLATALSQVKKSNDGAEAKKLVIQTEKLGKVTTELTAVEKERIKIQSQLKSIFAKNLTANEKNTQVLAKGKLRLQETNKLLKENAKEALGLVGAYGRLTKKTLEAQKKFKDLAAEFGENSKQAKKAKTEFLKLDKQLTKVNQSAKDGKPKVGSYAAGIKRVALQFAGALGLTALIGSAINVFRNAGKIFITFEKSASRLAAILGKTKDGITSLTKQAKDLGSTTAYTASEVLSLQTELAKLGFTQNEIENSTKGVLSLAAATGSELARAAEVAGSTLRGFGLDATEMSRITDLMALSTTKSALDIENFAESMKLVAPIAKAANINIETTTALLGELANAGLKGSIAGTSLKNLLSKLSDENSKLSKRLGFAVKGTDDLFKAFNLLKKGNIDLTEATQLTDERSKAAFFTFINGIDNVKDLKSALDNASGAAENMANVMLDNLAGDLTIAKSAWEGFILSIEDGNGVITEVSRNAIKWFTGVFEALKKVNEGQNLYTQKLQKDSDIVGQISKRWNKYQTEIWNTNNAEEEANLIRSKTIRLQRQVSGINYTLNKGAEKGVELSIRRRSELELEVYFYNQLIGKLKNYNTEGSESNKIIKENTDKSNKNNTSKKKQIDLLSDEQRILDQTTQLQIKNIEDEKRRLTLQANYENEIELAKIEKSKANLSTKNAAIEQLEIAHQQKLAEINKKFAIEELKPKGEADPFAALNEQIEAEAKIKAEARQAEFEAEQNQAEAIKGIKETALSEGMKFASDIFAFEQDSKLAKIKNNIEAEKELLKAKLDKNQISEENYIKEIDKLNKKSKNAQAKAEKRKALFDIGIATAVGVVKALPNYILAAAVGITGAIQAAFVAARPVPKFEKGEINIKGNRHSKGGINANIEGGESVINRIGTTNAPLLLSFINKGLIKDNQDLLMPKDNQDSLISSLLMQGNKQNTEIIQVLSNLGISYENKGLIHIQQGDGTLRKIVKNG